MLSGVTVDVSTRSADASLQRNFLPIAITNTPGSSTIGPFPHGTGGWDRVLLAGASWNGNASQATLTPAPIGDQYTGNWFPLLSGYEQLHLQAAVGKFRVETFVHNAPVYFAWVYFGTPPQGALPDPQDVFLGAEYYNGTSSQWADCRPFLRADAPYEARLLHLQKFISRDLNTASEGTTTGEHTHTLHTSKFLAGTEVLPKWVEDPGPAPSFTASQWHDGERETTGESTILETTDTITGASYFYEHEFDLPLYGLPVEPNRPYLTTPDVDTQVRRGALALYCLTQRAQPVCFKFFIQIQFS